MAIIVEDGTGKEDAESYASVNEFKAYHRARGNEEAADLDADVIEPLLRQATDYLGSYAEQWKGSRITAEQALDWPRSSVTVHGFDVAEDTVPANVVKACCVLAEKARSGPLAADQGQAKIRQKIGPIETEYDKDSPRAMQYADAQRLLAPYLREFNPYSATLARS